MSNEETIIEEDINQVFEDILLTEERLNEQGYSVSTSTIDKHKMLILDVLLL